MPSISLSLNTQKRGKTLVSQYNEQSNKKIYLIHPKMFRTKIYNNLSMPPFTDIIPMENYSELRACTRQGIVKSGIAYISI